MSCANVNTDLEEDDLEGRRHMTFQETEGEKDIQEGPSKDATHFLPVKLQKQNTSLENKPKMASIGDYWDEKTTKNFFYLLHEYEGLLL